MQKAFAEIDIRDATSYKLKEKQMIMNEIAKMEGESSEHGSWSDLPTQPPAAAAITHVTVHANRWGYYRESSPVRATHSMGAHHRERGGRKAWRSGKPMQAQTTVNSTLAAGCWLFADSFTPSLAHLPALDV